jgi:F-type H+-transporting ATPase subunit epsilon
MTLHVEIITPDQTAFEGEADSITLPTMSGEITVLRNHMPLLTIVKAGSMLIRKGGTEQLFAVTRGIAEIDGGQVRVLTDTADRAEDLELEAIEQAKLAAEQLKDERRHDSEEFAAATAILERETARLQVVRRHRERRSPTFGQ